jgi:flagellar protein FlbD
MISVTRLHGEPIVINAGLIEFVEMTPDTLISLATGKKIMVRESVDEVVELVITYQRRIGNPQIVPHNLETPEDQ